VRIEVQADASIDKVGVCAHGVETGTNVVARDSGDVEAVDSDAPGGELYHPEEGECESAFSAAGAAADADFFAGADGERDER
jgi:hypothetical protein